MIEIKSGDASYVMPLNYINFLKSYWYMDEHRGGKMYYVIDTKIKELFVEKEEYERIKNILK